MLKAATDQLATIAGQQPERSSRAQVDRRVQTARGHACRGRRDAARRAQLRVPRPAHLGRHPADPRLPRAEPALLRRARQLLAGRQGADHLPRDRLRQNRHGPRAGHHHHHLRRHRPGGLRAAGRARHAVLRPGPPKGYDPDADEAAQRAHEEAEARQRRCRRRSPRPRSPKPRSQRPAAPKQAAETAGASRQPRRPSQEGAAGARGRSRSPSPSCCRPRPRASFEAAPPEPEIEAPPRPSRGGRRRPSPRLRERRRGGSRRPAPRRSADRPRAGAREPAAATERDSRSGRRRPSRATSPDGDTTTEKESTD